jgi:hypothetical protein
MSKGKWFIVLLAVVLAIPVFTPLPSHAVQLTLGGFPSFMRTRARFIKDATFLSALDGPQIEALGFELEKDEVMFVDTRLRLTPQLVLSDAVTVRAQVDVADNYIWGGMNLNLERDVVWESVTPGDRFRGSLLVAPVGNVLFNGLGFLPGFPGRPPFDCGIGETPGETCGTALFNSSAEEIQWFNVRMLHVDIVLPGNLGFLRIGRQPFDWGIGILANGGWDPLSDLGFVLDRFLYLKSFPIGAGTFTFVFVSDRLKQGTALVRANGSGYDIGAVALVYNQGPVTVGVYDFPYIHQTNFFGDIDLAWLNLWSGLIDVKTDVFRFVVEAQGAFGKLDDTGADDIDIEPTNIIGAARVELYPGFPVKLLAVEGGIAFGDEVDPAGDGGDFQGNVLAFSPAFILDNLLFKHMLPNIYGIENSVINAYYGRAWGTLKFTDDLSFTPQVVVAFNDETDTPLVPEGFFPGVDSEVSRYLGTEVEGTLTIEIVPGVNLDLIGSLVINGSGLEDLLEQRAALELQRTGIDAGATPDDVDAESYAWAVQGRLLVFIDQFFK